MLHFVNKEGVSIRIERNASPETPVFRATATPSTIEIIGYVGKKAKTHKGVYSVCVLSKADALALADWIKATLGSDNAAR